MANAHKPEDLTTLSDAELKARLDELPRIQGGVMATALVGHARAGSSASPGHGVAHAVHITSSIGPGLVHYAANYNAIANKRLNALANMIAPPQYISYPNQKTSPPRKT
mgnify:CR=1 FL=1